MRAICCAMIGLVCVWNTAVQAEDDFRSDSSMSDDDFAEFEELMEILDEETTVATKTKLNSDYVPGMVTVLQREELQALGIATVWEALALVPGMQVYRHPRGDPFVTVRGLPFPFNSGNIKIMINSVSMSRETSAVNTSALLMPVEQVERIEVIRGPGSSVYGNFAFMGLVNVITEKGDNSGFASVSNGDRYAAGAHFSRTTENIAFDVNVAGWTSNDGEGAINNADPDEDRVTAVSSLQYGNTTLSLQLSDRKYASNQSSDERNQAVDVRHQAKLSDSWHVDVAANYLDTDSESGSVFKGDLTHVEVDVGWTAKRMDWLFAASSTNANIDSASLNPPGRPQEATVVRDGGWDSYSAAIQGQFRVRDDITVTAGLRRDSRDDINATRLTPRLAFVWQAHEEHLIKAQYSEGFRAPTFFELFGLGAGDGNFTLEFESISTTELSYVFRDPNRTGRVTLFQSDLADMIFPAAASGPGPADENGAPPGGDTPAGKPAQGGPPPGPPPAFGNGAKANSRGVEVEWEQRLSEKLKWSANLSYADASDTRSQSGLEGTPNGLAHWLGNVAVVGRPRRDLLVTGHLYRVGARATEAGDVDGYSAIDLSVSAFHLGAKGLTLRASIKNVLDDKVRYLLGLPSGTAVDEHDGRSWRLQLSYQL